MDRRYTESEVAEIPDRMVAMMAIAAAARARDVAAFVATGGFIAFVGGCVVWGRCHLDRWVERTGRRHKTAFQEAGSVPPTRP